MINISDTLLAYLRSTTRQIGQYMRVEIVTKEGKTYTVTDNELSGGSVKINKKSVSNSTFDIGECYINDVTLSIIDKNNTYTGNFDNAILSVFFGVRNVSLGLDEEIQLGKFVVPTDTTVRKLTVIQLSGDSLLSRLDKQTNGVATSGSLYSIVKWCCDACDVELALTEEEFNALSLNTGFTYFIPSDTSIKTYRDVVMYISQILGGFATDTNDGKLTFKVYKMSNNVFDINNDTVASSKLGDSAYKLSGIGITYSDKNIHVGGGTDQSYTLELDSNPLLDMLTEDLVNIILNNMWEQLKNIQFRAFDFEYNGNPALECGDILSNSVRGVTSFITSLSWTYHGKSSVVGVTLDNRVKTQSQGIKKASASGGGGSSNNELAILRYINTEEFVLNKNKKRIIQMYFVLPSGVSPLLTFTMVLKNELSGLVSLVIRYDNVEMIYKPREQVGIGYHTFSFSKSLDPTDREMLHSLAIWATFTEDTGQSIESKKPCSIAIYDIEANIMGWKAVKSEPSWTGIYEVEDSFGLMNISSDNIKLLPFSDGNTSISFNT